MSDCFHTLLLLALPASGKSEVRTFLDQRDPVAFHMGPTVQLDDYPYVHLQLLVDEALVAMGEERLYHHPDPKGQRNGPFIDSFDMGGLVQLLNDDYHELLTGIADRPESPARRLLERFDAASERAGAKAKLRLLSDSVRAKLEVAMQNEATAFYEAKAKNVPASLQGRTIVIEFARGGPNTGTMPLPPGYGYKDSLNQLSPEILANAAVLYIWVDAEESRRKNIERARPNGVDSILFHGTPESVMDQEYGACDMTSLIQMSDAPGTLTIETATKVFYVPVARFDNRRDLTTFLRKDPSDWTEAEVAGIHDSLKEACDHLWAAVKKDSR